jgi:hypothetical protein
MGTAGFPILGTGHVADGFAEDAQASISFGDS